MKKVKFYLLLLLIFFFPLTGCGTVSPDTAFEDWCNHTFASELSQNTLNLHYTLQHPENYGIKSASVSLGSFDLAEQEKMLINKKVYLSALSSFDYNALSLENRLTYDILAYDLNQSLADTEFFFYEEPLGSVTGMQAELPILLSEYRFYTGADIPVYLNLLSQVDDYFDSILAFEEEKSKQGLFMSKQAAQAVIEQCEDFIENPSQNMLVTTFRNRMENLSQLNPRLKESYQQQNDNIFYGSIVPAYEEIISTLSRLVDTSQNQNGLCYLPKGKEVYEAKVQSLVGCQRTIAEIKSLIQHYYKEDLLALKSCLEKGEITSPVLMDTAKENPNAILSSLAQKIQADFPKIPMETYQVKYVDDSLKDHISPAFYLTPPIDNAADNVIYINPAMELKDLSLFTTLAHEGYPGHLYQTVFAVSKDTAPIRSLLSFGGYTEGWATYGEMYSYGLYGLDANSADYYMHSNALNLSLYAIADIGIHYDGWQMAQLTEFFSPYGITDKSSIESIQTAILENPGNYLKYYVGYLEFLELKEKAQGVSYSEYPSDLKAFHNVILSIGEAPFPIIEKYLPEYYSFLYSSK
ncbi:MAG: DUF885 domain-containing protein [Lachnospiraceae bacterium]|nr:DUF885 domain-containing protein [Lachnospiraceae bacterium]